MASPVYKASPGFHISHRDAAILGPAWEKLERRLKRPPTPSDLVEEAKKSDSPWHPYFEWRVEQQVELYLAGRARYLITALTVLLPERGDVPVRAIVPVHDGSGGYMSTAKASRERPDVIAAQVTRARADAKSVVERYQGWIAFNEFQPARSFVEAARALATEA